MRPFVILSSLIAAMPVLAAQETQPTSFPVSRYDKMLEESPFALATPQAPPPAPKDSFTKEWVLEGLSKVRGEDGVERDLVYIRSRDQTQRFALAGSDQNSEGVSIASVERSPQVGKSKVTLKKGNEFGVVEYDQMVVESAASPAAAEGNAGRPNQPGMPAGNPAFNNRGTNPGANGRPAIPRPSGIPAPNGKIPQPPVNPQQPQQMNTGAAPLPGAVPAPAGSSPRRIRVINTKP